LTMYTMVYSVLVFSLLKIHGCAMSTASLTLTLIAILYVPAATRAVIFGITILQYC
jgi:hypothetical protein